MTEAEPRELGTNLPEVIILNREELLLSPLIENPTTPDEAFRNLLIDLSSIDSIAGIDIRYDSTSGLANTYYKGEGLNSITDEDEEKEYNVQNKFNETLKRLGYKQVIFGWVTALGDLSYEEVVKMQQKEIASISEESINKVNEGDIPADMDVIQTLNVMAGLYGKDVEEPVYIKFE